MLLKRRSSLPAIGAELKRRPDSHMYVDGVIASLRRNRSCMDQVDNITSELNKWIFMAVLDCVPY